jgi:hypothetical protein
VRDETFRRVPELVKALEQVSAEESLGTLLCKGGVPLRTA